MNRHIEADHISIDSSVSNHMIESKHDLTAIPQLLFKALLEGSKCLRQFINVINLLRTFQITEVELEVYCPTLNSLVAQ